MPGIAATAFLLRFRVDLNALEFLRYLAAAKGLEKHSADKRIDQLLELVNLTDVRKRALGKLSGG